VKLNVRPQFLVAILKGWRCSSFWSHNCSWRLVIANFLARSRQKGRDTTSTEYDLYSLHYGKGDRDGNGKPLELKGNDKYQFAW